MRHRLPTSIGLGVLALALAAPPAANAQVFGCVPPPSGQVAWYPFDETSGPVAADLAGSNPGTYQNGPLPVPGKVGEALDFDGIDDFVLVPDAAVLDFGHGDFSIETWVRTTEEDVNIVYKRAKLDAMWIGYVLMLYDGRPLFQMANAAGYTNYFSLTGANLADGIWHHVAVSVDRDNVTGGRIYVDGALVHTFNPMGGTVSNAANLSIGRSGFNADELDGTLDELGLYNRALTAGEVQAIHAAGDAGKCKATGCAPAPAGLAAWYPLDETSGTVAEDLQGTNDGAHQGSPAPVAGRVGGGLSLDGTDFVSIPDNAALDVGTGDFSLGAWVRTTDAYGAIVSKRQYNLGEPHLGYSLMVNNGRLWVEISDAVSGTYYFAPPAASPLVSDGAWHHVAVTVDRDNAIGGRVYVDGVLSHKFDPRARAGSLSNISPLTLGRSSNINGDYLTGTLDEVQLFHRSLTPGEVQALAGIGGVCKP